MKYIQTFNTKQEALKFKEQILNEKSEVPHRYIVRILETKSTLIFSDTDWKLPKKPVVFEYEKESLATKKFIDVLIKNKMLGSHHDYNDKNVYVEDIPNITSLGKLFCGGLNKETMSLTKPKNVINDFSCLEKLEYIEDISGIDSNGDSMNLFAASSTNKIRLPKNLKVIGNSAFAFCTNLEDIKISENIETIKSKAFFNCISLEEIEIPKNVKKIESAVFSNSGIKKIIMNCDIIPTIAKTTFSKMRDDFEIFVDKEKYDEYIEKWGFIADHIFTK